MTAEAPELATGRVRLRRLRPEDAPDFHQAFGDPAAMRFWDSPPTRDVAETEARIHASLSADPAVHAAFAVLARDHSARSWAWSTTMPAIPGNRRLGVGWLLVPRATGKAT